ncbi:MAG TPA: Mpo1-like protein [Cyclobacteriaceae bacterium]|nr:Mpo1-like protein [Cyclobacteriaceae bacterium]
MRKIDQLLSEYGESHQNETNKAIHWICVPLIFFSVVGLLASIPPGPVQRILGEGNPYANWATIMLVVAIAYYVTLSIPLTVGMMLFAVMCLFVARTIAETGIPLWAASLTIFVVAWIGQFYGHKVEGKKPSFFKDLQFLMIGPAWLMHFIYKKVGIPY